MNTTTTASIGAFLATALFAETVGQSAQAGSLEVEKPYTGSTMFFSDRYATGYYTVDKVTFRTVITVAPGPDGKGQPMQFTNDLADGEKAEYLIGGYGDNAIKVKLMLRRIGENVITDIKTEVPSGNS